MSEMQVVCGKIIGENSAGKGAIITLSVLNKEKL